MRRRNVCTLVFGVLAGLFAPTTTGQDGQDERLYQALSAPQNAEFDRAVWSWVRERRRANDELMSGLKRASEKLGRKDLTFSAVLLKHGPPETTKVLHEYSEDGLRRVLSVSDSAFRQGVVEELRWVEQLEGQVRKSVEAGEPDPEDLLKSADTYAGLLLDLDAKMVAALRVEGSSALECEVTARTVDSSAILAEAKERPNYTVVYVLEFWESDPKKWRTFDKLSSPTAQKLSAGYYVMWCQRTGPDGQLQEGERKRVVVTEPKEVDLLVTRPEKG